MILDSTAERQPRTSNSEPGYEDFSKSKAQPSATVSSTRVPFWGTDPNAWDRVRLAGVELPGTAKVKGKVAQRVDRKSIPGTHGQTFTHIGYEPAMLELKIVLFTPEHLERWLAIVPQLRPRRERPQPVDIVHPSTAMFGINSVLVIEIDLPEYDERNDYMTVSMRVRENVVGGKKGANVGPSNTSRDVASLGTTAQQDRQRASEQNPKNTNTAP